MPIERSINLFFFSIVWISFCIAIFGWFKLYNSLITKFIACSATLLLAYKATAIGDVYLAYFACVICLMPWSLYFAKRNFYDNYLLLFLCCAGFTISFFNYIRAYAGFGVFLFMIFLFATSLNITKKQWLNLSFAFLVGASIPNIYFNYSYNQSIIYIKNSSTTMPEKKHVFWHNIYIGFGFLQDNNPGIIYDDSAGEKKVQETTPGLTLEKTQEYEAILKNEVINLIKNHWQFVLFTLFAKLGILLFYLLQYANVGLFLALLFPKPWNLEIAFLLALAFYAIFPLLTMPYPEYALGFISCATIYGIVSINYVVQKNNLKRILNRFAVFNN